MEREKFKSRLGFILISAGCAIGIGNVWRFPYVVGNNGGGCFVLFYVFFTNRLQSEQDYSIIDLRKRAVKTASQNYRRKIA